jgi:hypothetical protein
VFTSPISDFLARAHERGVTGIHRILRGDTIDLPLRDPWATQATPVD